MGKQSMSVFEELLARAALKPPKDAGDQVFLAKLAKAINSLPDEEWEAMSEGAQKWSNAAQKAKEKDTDYPVVPGAPKAGDDAEGEEGDEEGEAQVAKKAAKKSAAAPKKSATNTPSGGAAKKAAPAKKAATAPAKKAANGEKPAKSMLRAAREIICKAPHLTVDDIIKKLETSGYEAAPVTISTIRSDTRNTLKIAQEMKVELAKLDFDK